MLTGEILRAKGYCPPTEAQRGAIIITDLQKLFIFTRNCMLKAITIPLDNLLLLFPRHTCLREHAAVKGSILHRREVDLSHEMLDIANSDRSYIHCPSSGETICNVQCSPKCTGQPRGERMPTLDESRHAGTRCGPKGTQAVNQAANRVSGDS